jgi:predicted Zn-dependent peptidase
VTPQDIQRVAQKYFTENAVVQIQLSPSEK